MYGDNKRIKFEIVDQSDLSKNKDIKKNRRDWAKSK